MEKLELKSWLNHNIQFIERKIMYMEEHVPDHRNIKYFKGHLEMAQKIYKKINEVEVHQILTATKNEFHTIEDGKECTIRKGHRPIRLEPLKFWMLNGEESIIVKVRQVIHCNVHDLPNEYVRRDEFVDKHDLINQLQTYYPDIDGDTEITVVVFEHIK